VEPQLRALAETGALLDRVGLDHWLFGGWAVDFYAGSVTRAHSDVDLAVWLRDRDRIHALLEEHGWRHAPEPDEDGGTGFERGGVRLELTYLKGDERGRVFIPLHAGDVLWSEAPLGSEVRELLGVRARIVPKALLR
jgi:Aminoglycoside-2''-adenylyltransferase